MGSQNYVFFYDNSQKLSSCDLMMNSPRVSKAFGLCLVWRLSFYFLSERRTWRVHGIGRSASEIPGIGWAKTLFLLLRDCSYFRASRPSSIYMMICEIIYRTSSLLRHGLLPWFGIACMNITIILQFLAASLVARLSTAHLKLLGDSLVLCAVLCAQRWSFKSYCLLKVGFLTANDTWPREDIYASP